jgi:hypothetical protein
VQNIGFDNSGTHNGNESLNQELYLQPLSFNADTTIQFDHYAKFLNYFTVNAKPLSLLSRVKKRVKSILKIA